MSAGGPPRGGGGPGAPGWSPVHFRGPSPYAPSPPPRLLGSPAAKMFAGAGNRYGMPCPRPRWPTPMSPPVPHASSPGPRPFRRPMHPVSECQ